MTIHHILQKKYVTLLLLTLMFAAIPAIADELKDISKLAEQGQQEAALKRINTYLEANPKDAQGLFTKGIIQAESGQRDDAIKTFNTLTKTYPNLPEPYNNLAVLHAEAGEFDLAKKALETAIKTHPSYATAHENLGDIYARMASEAYDKALKLDNGNTRAQSKLLLIKDLFSTDSKTAVAVNTASPTRPIRPANKKVDSTPTPVSAATPAPSPVADTTADSENSITAAVEAWRNAWSSQDIEQYLASYANSFMPSKGSRDSWEKVRRDRVTKPSNITVTISEQKIEMIDASNAKISFKQYYKADGGPINTNKTLVLKKENGAWLIHEEIASN